MHQSKTVRDLTDVYTFLAVAAIMLLAAIASICWDWKEGRESIPPKVSAAPSYPRDEGREVWLAGGGNAAAPVSAQAASRMAPEATTKPFSVKALMATPHHPVSLAQPPQAKDQARREKVLIAWAKRQGAKDLVAIRAVKAALGFQHVADPYLVLAITKVESSFDPKAVSFANARGLMQVIEAKHPEKWAGKDKAKIEDQILVGAKVVQEYSKWYSGDLRKVFITYSGNASDYQQKVMKARNEILREISNT